MPRIQDDILTDFLLGAGQSITSPEFNLHQLNRFVYLEIDRAGLGGSENEVVLKVTTEYFDDTLGEWLKGPGFSTTGGTLIDRNSEVIPVSKVAFNTENRPGRKLRVTAEAPAGDISITARLVQDATS